jgi:hypothetical protein
MIGMLISLYMKPLREVSNGTGGARRRKLAKNVPILSASTLARTKFPEVACASARGRVKGAASILQPSQLH